MAYKECQNFDAKVHNARALYKVQIGIMDGAIKANPSSPELALKHVKLIEKQFSSEADEVKDAWEKVCF